VDPWNQPYVYDPARAQLISGGSDRRPGNADDLIFPPSPRLILGDLSVSVVGVPGSGPERSLGAADVEVWLSSSAAGVRTEARMAGSGPFHAGGIHRGLHGLRAEGRASYAGVVTREVVVVRRGLTHVRLTLVQP
jgi:hypothetical protein